MQNLKKMQPMRTIPYHLLFSTTLLALLLFINPTTHAQLNCKTTERNDSTITTCLHASKKPSSVESWDKNRYWGRMTCFDAQGNIIANHQLRRVAGHASVSLRYHPNGQVSSVEYRSAPDGGIQLYHTIQSFDENGNQTSYEDYSQPDGRPVLRVIIDPQYQPEHKEPALPPLPKQIVEQCAIPYLTVFRLTNNTRKKIVVNLVPLGGQWATLKAYNGYVLKPKQSVLVDSITLAERYLHINDTYSIQVISPKKLNRQPKVVIDMPIEGKDRKEYVWHLIDK